MVEITYCDQCDGDEGEQDTLYESDYGNLCYGCLPPDLQAYVDGIERLKTYGLMGDD